MPKPFSQIGQMVADHLHKLAKWSLLPFTQIGQMVSRPFTQIGQIPIQELLNHKNHYTKHELLHIAGNFIPGQDIPYPHPQTQPLTPSASLQGFPHPPGSAAPLPQTRRHLSWKLESTAQGRNPAHLASRVDADIADSPDTLRAVTASF